MVGGARHILVASNNASSGTIPGGIGRNNAAYRVNRNGTTGHLGTPDPDNDYLIGSIVDSISDMRRLHYLHGVETHQWNIYLGSKEIW